MNIQDIMAKATGAVEFMYDKKASIKRSVPYVKPNGADGMHFVEVHADIPCRLSTTGSANLNNTDMAEVNRIQYDMKLFLSSAVEVFAGDEVTAGGIVFEAAKEPVVYVSHQEVMLLRKEYA